MIEGSTLLYLSDKCDVDHIITEDLSQASRRANIEASSQLSSLVSLKARVRHYGSEPPAQYRFM
jgi:hypothetical protein